MRALARPEVVALDVDQASVRPRRGHSVPEKLLHLALQLRDISLGELLYVGCAHVAVVVELPHVISVVAAGREEPPQAGVHSPGVLLSCRRPRREGLVEQKVQDSLLAHEDFYDLLTLLLRQALLTLFALEVTALLSVVDVLVLGERLRAFLCDLILHVI